MYFADERYNSDDNSADASMPAQPDAQSNNNEMERDGSETDDEDALWVADEGYESEEAGAEESDGEFMEDEYEF